MSQTAKAEARNEVTSQRASPYFLTVVAVFITCLITSNIMAVKLVGVFGLIVPAAVFVFPLSYLFGDILTEVYGYAQTRRVIWLGFGCNLVAVIGFWLGQVLPGAVFWDAQAAYVRILGYTPRLLGASLAAYLVGEFVNSYIMAKLKIATGGRWLWTRTWTSTLVGQALDSTIFISLAFLGAVPLATLPVIIGSQWIIKAAYEIAATPITYAVVGFLKRREGMDKFDRSTNFNPLFVREA